MNKSMWPDFLKNPPHDLIIDRVLHPGFNVIAFFRNPGEFLIEMAIRHHQPSRIEATGAEEAIVDALRRSFLPPHILAKQIEHGGVWVNSSSWQNEPATVSQKAQDWPQIAQYLKS